MKIKDFALCIEKIDDETDFEPAKIYPVLEPLVTTNPQGYLRIVDESGEDYLYPAQYFQMRELDRTVSNKLKHHFEMVLAQSPEPESARNSDVYEEHRKNIKD